MVSYGETKEKVGVADMESYRNKLLQMAENRYGTQPEYLWTTFPDFAVLRRTDSRKWYALIAAVPKDKLGLTGSGHVDILNVKCDSRLIGSLREEPGFFPAYHMHRGSWISILLDGSVDLERIAPLLDMSYELAAKKSGTKRSLRTRLTRKRDLPAVMEIYAKARQFMAEHGNPRQWGATNWPPERLIQADIHSRKSYVCEKDGKPVAVFYFNTGEDIEPTYAVIDDGSWQDESAYGVIHRIASDGTVRGAGTFCIQWAYEQCGHLRIDTHGDNTVMQNLLKKLGFVYCGIVHVPEDNDPRLAYEKSDRLAKREAGPGNTDGGET